LPAPPPLLTQEQDLHPTAALTPLPKQTSRENLGVINHQHVPWGEDGRKISDMGVRQRRSSAIQDQQAGLIALPQGVLRDQVTREFVVALV
jgi:hypothetical protein